MFNLISIKCILFLFFLILSNWEYHSILLDESRFIHNRWDRSYSYMSLGILYSWVCVWMYCNSLELFGSMILLLQVGLNFEFSLQTIRKQVDRSTRFYSLVFISLKNVSSFYCENKISMWIVQFQWVYK